jgi:tetratricopeptide (TPR) repeat protein
MKKISKIMVFLFLSVYAFEGCSNLLDVDSNRLVFPAGYKMNAANDTLYSMFGIFTQMEKLADSYVLLGELRGDLMDVTPTSNLYLKEINNFEISGTNPFANNIKDYYSVINNCNYVIHNIDTSVVKGGVKVMYKEYAACKAIRAWTYMQIALNYGTAQYYDKPLLTVQDAVNVQNSASLTLTELAPILINDISPWKDVATPTTGFIFTQNTNQSYFPIRFLLGDLYLWTGQYENAANAYRDLMFINSYIISTYYRNTLTVLNNAFTGNFNVYNLPTLSSENITNIAATNQYGRIFQLDSLALNHMIAPSNQSLNYWQKQMYYYSAKLDTTIDMRLYTSVTSLYKYANGTLNPNTGTGQQTIYSSNITSTSTNYVYKILAMNPEMTTISTNKQIMPYRVPLLYLRYAEAVNRLGKPNLAMAVLKNGLNRANMNNKKIIPQSELGTTLPNYMNFSDLRFDNNIGIRMRGCGNVNQDTTFYVIPNQAKLTLLNTDSIKYVEDLIVKELALETAFDGNRFQDLMRVAIRRDDNSYLANIVSSKFTSNKEAIRTKLLDRTKWYLTK